MPDQVPLDAQVLSDLRQCSTATLCTQLFKHGLRQQYLVGVKPLNPDVDGFVGEAYTMRFIPAREDLDTLESLGRPGNLQWEAVENLEAGQVLMVDSRDDVRAASAGDMLVTRAMKRGAAAFVTDGAFRDGYVIASLPFPAYARTVTATTRLSYFHVADLQVPIGCAGVAVYPGDVVVGDRDGVIVIPRALAPEVATTALEQERLEAYLHTRVLAGESLDGIYPPREHTIAQYKTYIADGGAAGPKARA